MRLLLERVRSHTLNFFSGAPVFPPADMDESSPSLGFHCLLCDILRVLSFVLPIGIVYLGVYFYFTKHFESIVFNLLLTKSLCGG